MAHASLIPTFGRQSQADLELQASMVYKVWDSQVHTEKFCLRERERERFAFSNEEMVRNRMGVFLEDI